MHFTKQVFFITFLTICLCQIACKRDGSQFVVKISQDGNFIQTQEIKFPPLKKDEGLEIKFDRAETRGIPGVFTIFTSKRRELFTLQEGAYSDWDELVLYVLHDNLPKKMFFHYLNTTETSFDFRNGLCFVDGIRGKAKVFLLDFFERYEIDDSATYLCVGKGGVVPVVTIYNLETIEEVKRVVYEPYRNTPMGPVSMAYENGAFIVMLGADTAEYTTIKIPITANEEWRVIDSFSFDD